MRLNTEAQGLGGLPLHDRPAAGRLLAGLLHRYEARRDVIVLALPRGGVPVAFEIARVLSVRLDVMLVRKLGLPSHRELAMGAIAQGGVRVLNEDVVRGYGIDDATLDAVAAEEGRELERRSQVYRGARPLPSLEGQVVILVDDGLATGATMRAAIEAVRRQRPSELVVAVPLASRQGVAALAQRVDRVVCPHMPEPFFAIGQWYHDFDQTTDAQVVALLQRAWAREVRW